jgi:hypothetical protein
VREQALARLTDLIVERGARRVAIDGPNLPPARDPSARSGNTQIVATSEKKFRRRHLSNRP